MLAYAQMGQVVYVVFVRFDYFRCALPHPVCFLSSELIVLLDNSDVASAPVVREI